MKSTRIIFTDERGSELEIWISKIGLNISIKDPDYEDIHSGITSVCVFDDKKDIGEIIKSFTIFFLEM